MRVSLWWFSVLFAGCSVEEPESRPPPAASQQERAPTGSLVRPPHQGSLHPTVDQDALLQAFPLASLGKVDGDVVSSPRDLAVIEQVRTRAARRRDLGEAVPVDLFLWASGEPSAPYLTKLGGVPHRERDRKWPRSPAGEAMTFVVQFCFADSQDILDAELPGEVLLVFFGEEWPWPGGRKQSVAHLEWSPRVLREPVSAEHMPKPGITVPVLHGVRHRSNEYPASFFGQDPDVFCEMGYSQSYHFAITQSTSIGHATWFIQNDPTSRGTRLIAALSSFQLDERWPLVDRELLEERPELMFYDVGCYYFLLDSRGRVRMEFDCY